MIVFSEKISELITKLVSSICILNWISSRLQELAYTYKINPSDFAEPWNATHYGVGLVPSDPACGCGSFANDDDVEGNVALIGTNGWSPMLLLRSKDDREHCGH